MSPVSYWRQLDGTVLDGRVVLRRLLSAEPLPVFAGELLEGGKPGGSGCIVRLVPDVPSQQTALERYLESTYLDHPNLLRSYGAGTFLFEQERFIYVISEPWDEPLDRMLRKRALPPRQARHLGLQVIEALKYLHERELVYCNLRPETVVRCGNTWKLFDFAQLRVAGDGYTRETRRLLAIEPGIPPEAFLGVVSPSWDSWGLAALLSSAVSGIPPADGGADAARQTGELPEPFATITAECFVGAVEERCGLDRIAELLREEPAPAPQPAQAAGSTSRQRAWAPAAPPPVPSFRDFKEHVTAPPVSTARRSKRRPVALAVLGIGALAVALAVATAVKRDEPGRAPDASGIQTSGPAGQAHTVPDKKPDPVFPPDNEEETPEPSAEASRESDPLIPPEDEPKPAPTEASSATATDQTAIQGLIYRWAAATRAGDADAQSAFYAPRVDVFYRARNVSRDWIRRNRDEALRKAGDIRTFKVSNLHMQQPTWDRAVVTFDKEWDFAGRKRDRGKVRGELVLLKRNGEWYISSERDVRVIERGA